MSPRQNECHVAYDILKWQVLREKGPYGQNDRNWDHGGIGKRMSDSKGGSISLMRET